MLPAFMDARPTRDVTPDLRRYPSKSGALRGGARDLKAGGLKCGGNMPALYRVQNAVDAVSTSRYTVGVYDVSSESLRKLVAGSFAAVGVAAVRHRN